MDVHLVMLQFAAATEEQRDELVTAAAQNRLPEIEEFWDFCDGGIM